MTEFNFCKRLANDGMSDNEIEELLDELADHKRDEQRDRDAEKHFDEKCGLNFA